MLILYKAQQRALHLPQYTSFNQLRRLVERTSDWNFIVNEIITQTKTVFNNYCGQQMLTTMLTATKRGLMIKTENSFLVNSPSNLFNTDDYYKDTFHSSFPSNLFNTDVRWLIHTTVSLWATLNYYFPTTDECGNIRTDSNIMNVNFEKFKIISRDIFIIQVVFLRVGDKRVMWVSKGDRAYRQSGGGVAAAPWVLTFSLYSALNVLGHSPSTLHFEVVC